MGLGNLGFAFALNGAGVGVAANIPLGGHGGGAAARGYDNGMHGSREVVARTERNREHAEGVRYAGGPEIAVGVSLNGVVNAVEGVFNGGQQPAPVVVGAPVMGAPGFGAPPVGYPPAGVDLATLGYMHGAHGDAKTVARVEENYLEKHNGIDNRPIVQQPPYGYAQPGAYAQSGPQIAVAANFGGRHEHIGVAIAAGQPGYVAQPGYYQQPAGYQPAVYNQPVGQAQQPVQPLNTTYQGQPTQTISTQPQGPAPTATEMQHTLTNMAETAGVMNMPATTAGRSSDGELANEFASGMKRLANANGKINVPATTLTVGEDNRTITIPAKEYTPQELTAVLTQNGTEHTKQAMGQAVSEKFSAQQTPVAGKATGAPVHLGPEEEKRQHTSAAPDAKHAATGANAHATGTHEPAHANAAQLAMNQKAQALLESMGHDTGQPHGATGKKEADLDGVIGKNTKASMVAAGIKNFDPNKPITQDMITQLQAEAKKHHEQGQTQAPAPSGIRPHDEGKQTDAPVVGANVPVLPDTTARLTQFAKQDPLNPNFVELAGSHLKPAASAPAAPVPAPANGPHAVASAEGKTAPAAAVNDQPLSAKDDRILIDAYKKAQYQPNLSDKDAAEGLQKMGLRDTKAHVDGVLKSGDLENLSKLSVSPAFQDTVNTLGFTQQAVTEKTTETKQMETKLATQSQLEHHEIGNLSAPPKIVQVASADTNLGRQ